MSDAEETFHVFYNMVEDIMSLKEQEWPRRYDRDEAIKLLQVIIQRLQPSYIILNNKAGELLVYSS